MLTKVWATHLDFHLRHLATSTGMASARPSSYSILATPCSTLTLRDKLSLTIEVHSRTRRCVTAQDIAPMDSLIFQTAYWVSYN